MATVKKTIKKVAEKSPEVKKVPVQLKEENVFAKITKTIMFYWVNNDLTKITMFRSHKLNEFVASFCNITIEESNQYVKDWFGDRANIKKVNDLLKYHNN